MFVYHQENQKIKATVVSILHITTDVMDLNMSLFPKKESPAAGSDTAVQISPTTDKPMTDPMQSLKFVPAPVDAEPSPERIALDTGIVKNLAAAYREVAIQNQLSVVPVSTDKIAA